MPYALMQSELETPQLDQLKEAFRVLPTLTALDAQNAAHETFGILRRGLDVEEASILQDALFKVGLQTIAVDEAELPIIPPAKLVKQMDFMAERLTMYDPLGRSFNLPAQDIMLVAAGNVRLPEYRKAKTAEALLTHGHGAAHPGLEGKAALDAEPFHLLLDVVLTGGIARYSVTADEFVFNHLGARMTPDVRENFLLLVRDLAQFAPHAGLNRGAFMVCENTGPLFTYPSKAAFYEEVSWMLWRIARAAAGE